MTGATAHSYGAAPGVIGRPMPATETKRETWEDWLPPDAPAPTDLMTRDELLARLREEGLAVSRDNLRDWQSAGAIPYGINRWHQGATRTLYAPWTVNIIRSLRTLQGDGRKMGEIKDLLRTAYYRAAGKPLVVPTQDGNLIFGGSTPHIIEAPTATATAEASPPTIAVLPDDLTERLIAFAHEHEALFDTRIARVDIRLVDENGIPLAFRINTHPI